MRDTKKMLARLRWALTVASDIVPKLPERGDGKLSIAVKTLAILDSLNKTKTKDNGLYHFFQKLDVTTQTNAQFVDLFFATSLKETFEIQKLNLTEYVDIIVATDEQIGTLYFAEYHWGASPEPSSDFWFSPGFKFSAALEKLWGSYGNGIHASMNPKGRTTYSKISAPDSSIGSRGESRLKLFAERHAVYREKRIPRTYLLLGKQGVGKTTFALKFAGNRRTLRIDARGLSTTAVQELGLILNGLKPDFMLIDDIDKVADLASALPTLLTTLATLKEQHADVTVVLTANSVAVLDAAFIRPGRIDEVLEFETPDEAERVEILRGYGMADPVLLATETAGLTAAYLRELALQRTLFPSVDVAPTVQKMKELADHMAIASGPPSPAPTKPGGP